MIDLAFLRLNVKPAIFMMDCSEIVRRRVTLVKGCFFG
jgi:hypothetical protein